MLPPLNPLPMKNGLRNRSATEFLGFWEQLNNPVFKPVEFDGFRKQAGLNSFTLTPKQKRVCPRSSLPVFGKEI